MHSLLLRLIHKEAKNFILCKFCHLQSRGWDQVMLLTCSVVLVVMVTVTSLMEGNGGVVEQVIPVVRLP